MSIVPNDYGLPNDSHWDVSTQGFVQPSDYLLASGGVIAYQGARDSERGPRPDLGI